MVGHPAHPAIPPFKNSKLYREDIQLIGIQIISIFKGKDKPTTKIWEVKHVSRSNWEVLYDKYETFEIGQIIKGGDVLKMINKGLYGRRYKTAWIKIKAVQYAARDMRFPVDCEYIYQMIIKGKNCYDLIAKTENRVIYRVGDLIPAKPKYKTSGLYRIQPARHKPKTKFVP